MGQEGREDSCACMSPRGQVMGVGEGRIPLPAVGLAKSSGIISVSSGAEEERSFRNEVGRLQSKAKWFRDPCRERTGRRLGGS